MKMITQEDNCRMPVVIAEGVLFDPFPTLKGLGLLLLIIINSTALRRLRVVAIT
jgi:hypothetical protein